jgi:hypothetical protein
MVTYMAEFFELIRAEESSAAVVLGRIVGVSVALLVASCTAMPI